MNGNDWKLELNRLLELFERESTISLREINRCFLASGCPFDEDFRQYFLKLSALRLNVSFSTILLEGLYAPNHGDEIVNNTNHSSSSEYNGDALNAPQNEDSIEFKIGSGINAPIEIADSDDGSAIGRQHSQALFDAMSDPAESNVFQVPINDIKNSGDCEQNGTNLSNENGTDVDVKLEPKDEIEFEIEEMDLPFVEFDPNKINDIDTSAENGIAAAEPIHGQSQSSSSSNVQKPSKRDAVKCFKCNKCAYTSREKGNVNRHQAIHVNGRVEPFKCEHCVYAFPCKSNLSRHQRVHDRQKLLGIVQDPNNGLYKCTHCTQQFAEMRFLTVHLAQSHKNNQRLFNCERCMRRFARNIDKDKHEMKCRGHHYECHLCKKYFTTRVSDMQAHMRTHSGAKPFKCAICEKGFRNKGDLIRHLNRVHSRSST